MWKKFAIGFVGGIVGASVVAAVLGGLSFRAWKRMGSFLPIVLEFTTDTKAKFYVYGYLSSHKGGKVAKLVIPPFALHTAGPTKSATSSPLLAGLMPVTLTPLDNSQVQPAIFHLKDDSHEAPGSASLSKLGVVFLDCEQTSGTNEAWGLAHEVVLEFPVS
jgi:hypothetical protein